MAVYLYHTLCRENMDESCKVVANICRDEISIHIPIKTAERSKHMELSYIGVHSSTNIKLVCVDVRAKRDNYPTVPSRWVARTSGHGKGLRLLLRELPLGSILAHPDMTFSSLAVPQNQLKL